MVRGMHGWFWYQELLHLRYHLAPKDLMCGVKRGRTTKDPADLDNHLADFDGSVTTYPYTISLKQ